MKALSFLVHSGIVSLFGLTMLVSCKNDIRTIQAFNVSDSIPCETARQVVMFYSDSGHTTTILRSKMLETFEGNNPYIEFPVGLHTRFFNADNQVTSTLRAGYGKHFTKSKLLEVRSDVVIVNLQKKEQLNTEKLTWNQSKRMIYTDAFVKITSPDKIIFGKGLEADEALNRRTLRQISGELMVDDQK